MDPANNEYVIKVKDVLYVILKKLWLIILVGTIVGGALFSYNVMQIVKTNDVLDITKRINAGETSEQYRLRVQKIKKAKAITQILDNINYQIDKEQAYISESIYMQIDPENLYVAAAQYSLSIEDSHSNGMDSVLFSAYEREIRYGDYLYDYADELGTKPEYIRELIVFSTSEADNTLISIDNTLDLSGSIYIYIYGPTREFVDETMDEVVAEICRINNELNSNVVQHNISLVGIQRSKWVDYTTRDGQNNHITRVNNLIDQVISYNSSLDTLASDLGISKQALINYVNSHDIANLDVVPTETSEKVISRKTMIKPNLKWFGIGFGAGALLIAVFVAMGYVFGKKILTQAQFFGLFLRIKRIGVMKPLGKRSKFIRFIDVKTEDDTKVSAEKCNGLISANYSNLTKDLNKVLITGTGDEKAMGDAVKALGLKGDFKPDIFNNPEVLKVVPDYDGIVLIEQRKKSLKPVVENEINLLSNGGTKIIGAIII